MSWSEVAPQTPTLRVINGRPCGFFKQTVLAVRPGMESESLACRIVQTRYEISGCKHSPGQFPVLFVQPDRIATMEATMSKLALAAVLINLLALSVPTFAQPECKNRCINTCGNDAQCLNKCMNKCK